MSTDVTADLPWTGERYVPQLRGLIALEHLHRYAFACQFVKDKVVLDIACGEGYGSDLLSRAAHQVYGIDIDKTTVAHATKKYSSDKLKFIEGSCDRIPLENHCVDVVVSYETIEHISEPSQMLQELKRVLRPQGLLIISSPEKEAYGATRPEQNPFHINEMDRLAFEKVLSAHFKQIQILGQSVLSGSFITSAQLPLPFGPRFQFSELPDRCIVANGLPDPVYVIGICSNGELPVITGSFCQQFIGESEEFQRLSEKLKWCEETMAWQADKLKWCEETMAWQAGKLKAT